MTPEEKLANAIIEMAADDYLKILRKKHLTNDDKHDKARLEDFFRSQWYTALTSVDGEYLLRKLKEKARDKSDSKPHNRKTVDHYKQSKVA